MTVIANWARDPFLTLERASPGGSSATFHGPDSQSFADNVDVVRFRVKFKCYQPANGFMKAKIRFRAKSVAMPEENFERWMPNNNNDPYPYEYYRGDCPNGQWVEETVEFLINWYFLGSFKLKVKTEVNVGATHAGSATPDFVDTGEKILELIKADSRITPEGVCCLGTR